MKAAPKRDLAKLAARFERDVVSGKRPVGKLFRAAVERHRRDLERAKKASFPYEFNPARGVHVATFVELLPHVEGTADLVGTKIRLEGWQVWAIMVAFGWVTRAGGRPRFRRITWFMPKGQGKTLLCAALALFVLVTEKGAGTVLSAATSRDQARQAFDAARRMLINSPDIVERFGIVVEEHAIKRPATGSKYVPVSSEARSVEGKLPRLLVEDEIHAHPKRDLHDNLRSMAAKRPDSQQVVISTAGFDMSPGAIGFEVYCYARDILLGTIEDDSQFALLIEADRDADPWAESTWRAANPNYGVSIDPVEVANEANEARQVPSKQPSFFTKRLGWWVQSGMVFIPVERWAACCSPERVAEMFARAAGNPITIGLDMALSRDLTARVRVAMEIGYDGARRYAVRATCYLAEGSVSIREIPTITQFASQGLLVLTPGDALSAPIVKADLLADMEDHPGSELVYDEWGDGKMIAASLSEEHGVTAVKARQGAQTLSAPMKELEAAVLSGRLFHDGDPVLGWCVGNLLAVTDTNDNVRPGKESPAKKIDAASALINALVRASVIQPDAGGSWFFDPIDHMSGGAEGTP